MVFRTRALLAGATLPSCVLVATGLPWPARVALIAVATLCCAQLARRADLRVRTVVAAIGVVLLVAVAFPPRESHDLWSYVEYGRILGVHGMSPYLHTPSQFSGDPFLHLAGWRTTPSVYGPAFNVFAALGAILGGHSMLLVRLWHQLSAAGALTAVLA